MTNIEFLKRHNLYDAHKHFTRLAESYIPTVLPEEEIDEAADDEDDMNNSPQDMGMNGNGGMAQDDGMDADAPQNNNGDTPPNDSMNGGPSPNDDMNGDMPQDGGMGNDEPQDNGMGGDMPQDNNMDSGMSDTPPLDGEEPFGNDNDASLSDDEDTIDINGLTKVQDKLNVKQNHLGRDLSKVDSRLSKLITTISSLLNRVEDNNNEIASLKAEFAKRNPTQTERLNLRSLDSYPFNVRPNDYWEKKTADSNYDVYSDNDEPTTQEYIITNDDVDNPSNDIADTFFKIDDDDIQTLNKIFNL